MNVEELVKEGFHKNPADTEASGRIMALGYAAEMTRLSSALGLDKIAQEAEGEEAEAEEEAAGDEGGDPIDGESAEALLKLLEELGGL